MADPGEPRCEACGGRMLAPCNFSGDPARTVVACFRCDPPTILCGICAEDHAACRGQGPSRTMPVGARD